MLTALSCFSGCGPILAATTFKEEINLSWTLVTIIAFIIGAIIALNGLIEPLLRGQDGERQRSLKISKGKNIKEKK
jgi:hypothetical protein